MGRNVRNSFDQLRTRFWYSAVSTAAQSSSAYRLNQIFGCEESKNWNKYKTGNRVPSSKTVNEVNGRFQGTLKTFQLGPYRLFEIMTAPRIHDAVAAITLELEVLCESNGFHITETPFCLENLSLANYLDGLGTEIFNKRNYYSFGDKVIPLAFAASHAESRFTGKKTAMADVIDDSLAYFELNFGIPISAWKYDKDISAAIEYSSIHKKMRALFEINV